MKPVIVQLIVDSGIDGPDIASQNASIQEKFGVDEEDFTEMKCDVCKKYIIGMVKHPLSKQPKRKNY